MPSRRNLLYPLVACALLVPGCSDSFDVVRFVDGASGAPDGPFGRTQSDMRVRDLPPTYACNTVDILFVIDNSGSMAQEQQNLIASFPKFIAAIEAIKPKIRSYHLGVVSTDIGAGGHLVPGKTPGSGCTGMGDDAQLQHKPRGTGCKSSYPKFLTGPGATLSSDFGCIANLGTDGCGFEQQFEVALQALKSRPYNKDFLRPRAPLAIIFITDEDDCSPKDAKKMFDFGDSALGLPTTRCVRLLADLHPIKRYVDGYRALKSDPKRVMVGVIAGPAATLTVDAKLPAGAKAACTSKLGDALPGNRFAELAKGFGERGIHHSICNGDMSSALTAITKVIERACVE